MVGERVAEWQTEGHRRAGSEKGRDGADGIVGVAPAYQPTATTVEARSKLEATNSSCQRDARLGGE